MNLKNQSIGRIFDIQRYCIHDGPGIRTMVFFKGCSLNCPWCSNPESINKRKEIIFHQNNCQRCGNCINSCTKGALTFCNDDIILNRELCDNCYECIKNCPTAALRIIGDDLTLEKVIEIINKDDVFYRRSFGGVTFSGGEATLQHQFLLDLINELKDRGIHTAIETCGYGKWENLVKLFRKIDVIYFDIKIIDSSRHKQVIGVPNTIILNNAKRTIEEFYEKVTFRIPIIPGYTDNRSNLQGIARYLKKCSFKKTIELVPYHRYGENKYLALNRDYLLRGVLPPSIIRLKEIKEIIEKEGIKTKIKV